MPPSTLSLSTSPDVETHVRSFYDDFGWTGADGAKGEDVSFRKFRPGYYPYHAAVEARTQTAMQPLSGDLLIVGCGDMPDSHIDIAKRFDSTTCPDISQKALDIAARRLPGASTQLGSILSGDIPENSFDTVFCAHVLYHIDAKQQAKAMQEMLRVVRPGGKVVVIYSNPRSPLRYLCSVAKRVNSALARAMGRRQQHRSRSGQDRPALYFVAHPLKWWQQFRDRSEIQMSPWDIIGSFEERQLIHGDGMARIFYAFASWVELRFPGLAVRLWQYPLIILTKTR
ncbi:class I SAM-dependent methyltransferase [Halovulum sp. GXIMD14793]